MNTYEVTIIHPRLDGPLVLEVPAMSERGAIAKGRLFAFHHYREATMLDATITVKEMQP